MSLDHHSLRLLVAASASFACCAPAVHADVLHSLQGYTVTVPSGWITKHETHSNTDGSSTDMVYTHSPHGLPVFRIEADPQGAATMRDAEAMQAAFVLSRMPGFRVMKQRRRSAGGSPATETMAVGMMQGQPIIADMIFTIHNGKSYTISLMTLPQIMKPDSATFLHILSTLHWSKATE